jgi:apolipoprotein N-acyltransferase
MWTLLSRKQILLLIISFLVVSFGQPSISPFFSLLTYSGALALTFFVLLEIKKLKARFFLATLWYTCVQLVQYEWFLSHPYYYILFLMAFLSLMAGVQFGFLSLLLSNKRSDLWVVPSFWVIMEYARLYFISGVTWNVLGLSLAGNSYSLLFASLGGVYFLSFWVVLVNLLALRFFTLKKDFVLYALCFIAPFFVGFVVKEVHQKKMQEAILCKVLLVQPNFSMFDQCSWTKEHYYLSALQKWKHILMLLAPYKGEVPDLVVLPECAVPFSIYSYLYPLDEIDLLFKEAFGGAAFEKKPFLQPSYYYPFEGGLVNNAFVAKWLRNILETNLVAGFADTDYFEEGRISCSYNAAHFFSKDSSKIERYEKQVLLPMGEYIPFPPLKKLAAHYGIQGSFSKGEMSRLWNQGQFYFSPSVCYEETFSGVMRASRKDQGALFVNVTNDGWYPESSLPKRHLDLAKIRTAENGQPLVRACNTGVTAAIDALGKEIAFLEAKEGVLLVNVPMYFYKTPYYYLGDKAILCFSFVALFFFFRKRKNLS